MHFLFGYFLTVCVKLYQWLLDIVAHLLRVDTNLSKVNTTISQLTSMQYNSE